MGLIWHINLLLFPLNTAKHIDLSDHCPRSGTEIAPIFYNGCHLLGVCRSLGCKHSSLMEAWIWEGEFPNVLCILTFFLTWYAHTNICTCGWRCGDIISHVERQKCSKCVYSDDIYVVWQICHTGHFRPEYYMCHICHTFSGCVFREYLLQSGSWISVLFTPRLVWGRKKVIFEPVPYDSDDDSSNEGDPDIIETALQDSMDSESGK